MEVDNLDLNESCRSCLSPANDLESIFSCYYKELQLTQILMNLVPLVISENDGLSSKICALCREKTLQSYEFQQTFLNSDKEQRDFLRANHCLNEFDMVLQQTSASEIAEETIYNAEETSCNAEETTCNAEETTYNAEENDDFVLKQDDIAHGPETIQTRYKCELCLDIFFTAEEGAAHNCSQNSVLEEDTLMYDEEPICDPIPTNQSAVSLKPKKMKYICHICQLPTETPSKLRRHLNTHKKDKNIENTEPLTQTFDCSKCLKQFYNEGSLSRHKIIHSDIMVKSRIVRDPDELFLCVICLAEVADYEQLSVHMRDHKSTSEDQIFDCKLCNKGYPGIKNIIRHAKTHEENGEID